MTDICPRKFAGFQSGEGLQYCVAAHAEGNAIAQAARRGVAIDGADMYIWGMQPCKNCAVLIVNAGIRRVICQNSSERYDEIAEKIFEESFILFIKNYDKDHKVKEDFFMRLSWQANAINRWIEREKKKGEYYLKVAQLSAQQSKCLSRKVGAVIVYDDCIISTGYNGPARGCSHCNNRTYGLPDEGPSINEKGEIA